MDDLDNKLEELIEADAPYRGWTRLTDNDIRYALPEYFENIADVERTMYGNSLDVEAPQKCGALLLYIKRKAERNLSLRLTLKNPYEK